MNPIRRYSGPTPTNAAGEYRIWLSEQPPDRFRRRFLELARADEVRPLRLTLERTAPAFTFQSSGDLKADLEAIDRLLRDATR
jgi:hypothetical protein